MRPPLVATLAVALALAGCVVGAAAPTARSSGAPVRFFAGEDARAEIVSSMDFGAQHSSFDLGLRGAVEATTVADKLVRMQNVDEKPHRVLLRATPLADLHVTRLTLTFRDAGGEARGTLDLRASAPAVQMDLAEGEALDAQLVIGVEDGATGGESSIGVTVLG